MSKAFINDENLTDIADAIRATLDESRQYLPSEMAAAIQSVPIMAQLNRKKYFQSVPAGAASGYATIEKVEGNTVKFNQLVQNGDFSDGSSYWASDGNGYGQITGVSNNILTYSLWTNNAYARIQQSLLLRSSHVYYVRMNVRPSNNTVCRITRSGIELPCNGNVWTECTDIVNITNDVNMLYLYCNRMGQLSSGNYVEYTNVQCIDLTRIFGTGNEPTTVADFEDWLAQNIGTLPYYDYNAGELLSVKMSGMQTEDSSQQVVDTMTLDVTTITGINTSTNVRETIFPQGMKQADYAGTVKDVLDLRSNTATVNVGSRAYQSGDESDTSVITDGTTTYYALTTPIDYTDLQDANGNPLNPRYKVEPGGTEQVLPVNTSTPTTVAPTLSTIYKKNA